jgi:hypothetical protein
LNPPAVLGSVFRSARGTVEKRGSAASPSQAEAGGSPTIPSQGTDPRSAMAAPQGARS